MSKYLLDTNVVSELAKPSNRRDSAVYHWYLHTPVIDQYISVITLGELHRGASEIGLRDEAKGTAFANEAYAWFSEFDAVHRVLPIDYDVARQWGELFRIHRLPILDGYLAATALVHNLTLVTRNVKHFEGLGVRIFNPFTPAT